VPDPASRSALVLDDDVLSQRVGKMGGERAGREVGDAAGREGDHDGDRARRPRFLRVQPIRLERERSRGKRKPKRQLQELPAVCHALPRPDGLAFEAAGPWSQYAIRGIRSEANGGPRIITKAPKDATAFLPVAELLSRYRRKDLSPVEMVDAVLEQVDRANGVVNAYCCVDREGARRSARDAEARWLAGAPRGLMDGVPVGVKDNILVAGMPARFGSRLTSDAPSTHDAPAVARPRAPSPVPLGKTPMPRVGGKTLTANPPIGKTTMPEFGWKAVTDSPLTGVTRNPWDTRKTPGGSSGGAVAAVVLGMGNIHLGTDGGGSIRIPAAFGGSYGIKPTRARVPAW